MTISAILETVLYAEDLVAAEAFYSNVLGMERIAHVENRHVFYKCGDQMLLIFNPYQTIRLPEHGTIPVPPHGAIGPGHVCFKASAAEIEDWHARLTQLGIFIDADFEWPQGGRSLYFRDPAGNSLEFAEPRNWGL
jgi:catechol 2,3-dioxygenase-like lactoylglutathione lyase family enzyme